MIMNAKSIVRIAIAGLALSLPLAASSTASARVLQNRHAVRNHGHDDRVIVRGHHRLGCLIVGSGHKRCWYGHRRVSTPEVRDHRTNPPNVRDHRAGHHHVSY
jgi:hypothetical protein